MKKVTDFPLSYDTYNDKYFIDKEEIEKIKEMWYKSLLGKEDTYKEDVKKKVPYGPTDVYIDEHTTITNITYKGVKIPIRVLDDIIKLYEETKKEV